MRDSAAFGTDDCGIVVYRTLDIPPRMGLYTYKTDHDGLPLNLKERLEFALYVIDKGS